MRDASDGWLTLGQAFPPDSGSPVLGGHALLEEGRRMVGLTTVIEQDCCRPMRDRLLRPCLCRHRGLQSIAVGNYANDHHY